MACAKSVRGRKKGSEAGNKGSIISNLAPGVRR